MDYRHALETDGWFVARNVLSEEDVRSLLIVFAMSPRTWTSTPIYQMSFPCRTQTWPSMRIRSTI